MPKKSAFARWLDREFSFKEAAQDILERLDDPDCTEAERHVLNTELDQLVEDYIFGKPQ